MPDRGPLKRKQIRSLEKLTRRQIRRLERLPRTHRVVSINHGGPPIVRGPNGQLLRVKPDGRLVGIVERVQSYLHVSG